MKKTGPGGIKCNCCRKGSIAKMKKITVRAIRKQGKKEIRLAFSS